MKNTDKVKELTAREQKEQDIAFNKEEDIITRMMKVLEHRGYVDTDWWSESTFEEDVRPLFEKMIKNSQGEYIGNEIVVAHNVWEKRKKGPEGGYDEEFPYWLGEQIKKIVE